MSTDRRDANLRTARLFGWAARDRRRALLLFLTVLAFGSGFARSFQRAPASPFRVLAPGSPFTGDHDPSLSGGEPRFRTGFVSRRHDATAHAASLVELGDGRLRAFWFSGTVEGALDVEIFSATFDPDRGAWSEARTVAEPEGTGRALRRHVRPLSCW